MEFSHDMALALFESKDPFPVDFDKAWQWIGYSAKQKAKSKLFNNFENGVDFLTKRVKTPEGGRPSELILLSNDCFKSLGMMAGTEKGKEIRRYFLDCERAAKEAAQIIPAQRHEIEKLRLELELAKAQRSLMDSVQMLEAISPGLAPLALGKSDAVVERVEVIEKVAVVDDKGRTKAQNSGQSKTTVAKKLGMKKAQELVDWLKSIDRTDLIEEGLTVVHCQYVPYEKLKEIRRLWSQRKGSRQRLIGES